MVASHLEIGEKSEKKSWETVKARKNESVLQMIKLENVDITRFISIFCQRMHV